MPRDRPGRLLFDFDRALDDWILLEQVAFYARERAMPSSSESLVEILDLERLEVDLFRGRSPGEDLQRVFGGQVAGQALVAAGRTVSAERNVHSLHAYFLRPGDPEVPIVYLVDRIRDGRSFTTRRVNAISCL